MTKKICIIGAGICGITSTKACLEQNFLPTVFEKTNYTCGLWRYNEHLDIDGIASVMKSTVINTSKEMSAFSDFPPPETTPNYMHNTKMAGYFDSYGDSFNFKNYVRFRHEILQLELSENFDKTGQWLVKYKIMDSGEIKQEIFDGVMICTGHHGTYYMPKFKGQENFKGTIMHTHSLKHAKGFEDKIVVVIGIGNSGGDAAIELSTVTKQVYLSTRRGSWINKRVGKFGQPTDSQLLRRSQSLLLKYLPYDLVCTRFEKQLNEFVDHENFQIKPKHRCFSQHIMINDALPNKILSGTVVIKSDIDYFTEDGVVFKGETEVTKCDAIIMATGYRINYPFLSNEILPVVNNAVRLYKFQFIPHLKQPHTLAFIGLIQPIGAIFPIAELQARWFAQLMLDNGVGNNKKLPTRQIMDSDIDRRLKLMRQRYYGSNRHTIQVDWIPFMDELSEEIGCKPPIWKYFFTDPKLFYTLMFEPSASYQYRLVGPNSWPKARETQINIQKRINKALKTNKILNQEEEQRKENLKSTNYNNTISMLILFFTIMIGIYGFLAKFF